MNSHLLERLNEREKDLKKEIRKEGFWGRGKRRGMGAASIFSMKGTLAVNARWDSSNGVSKIQYLLKYMIQFRLGGGKGDGALSIYLVLLLYHLAARNP